MLWSTAAPVGRLQIGCLHLTGWRWDGCADDADNGGDGGDADNGGADDADNGGDGDDAAIDDGWQWV